MAKKSKTTASRSSRSGGQSPCQQGGPEILPSGPIRMRADDVATLVLYVCRSPARVRVDVDGARVTDTTVTDSLSITLPRMSPGIHTVIWSFLFASSNWQTRIELLVNGVPVFRQRKGDQESSFPTNRGFAVIEVVS